MYLILVALVAYVILVSKPRCVTVRFLGGLCFLLRCVEYTSHISSHMMIFFMLQQWHVGLFGNVFPDTRLLCGVLDVECQLS